MKCEYVKQNGKKCGAWAMKGSKFCYLHNPENQEKRINGSSKGGKAIKRYEPLPPVKIKEAGDVVSLLGDTINQVRAGKIGLKTANCIGYLSGHLTKAIEISDLAEKVKILEQIITKQNRR